MAYTKQQTFNMVATHLLTQRKKSKGKNGCYYRRPNGLKCAIGCLIPDDRYTPDVEGANCLAPEVGPMLRSLGHDPVFLRPLQAIHDGYHPNSWPRLLGDFAKAERLDTSVIDQFARK